MSELVEGYTNEELYIKMGLEGFDYLWMSYFSPEKILHKGLKEAVLRLREASYDIEEILQEEGVYDYEDEDYDV